MSVILVVSQTIRAEETFNPYKNLISLLSNLKLICVLLLINLNDFLDFICTLNTLPIIYLLISLYLCLRN